MIRMAVPQTALILGASSMLGRALALEYAALGWRIVLCGRDVEELKRCAADLAIRTSAAVDTISVDLTDGPSIDKCAVEILTKGLPRVTIFVAGAIDGAAEAPYDPVIMRNLHTINYMGVAHLVGALLPALKAASGSTIAFISSVAGDRGRRSNFVYGAAKAALNTYCQGLRALLPPNAVSILTVKLGYLDTRMAYGLAPSRLMCSPGYAAKVIRRSIERRRMVVYVPWFWHWICLVVRVIPERLFIRLPIP